MSAGEGEGEEDRDELTQCSTVQGSCPVCPLVLGPPLGSLRVFCVWRGKEELSRARHDRQVACHQEFEKHANLSEPDSPSGIQWSSMIDRLPAVS